MVYIPSEVKEYHSKTVTTNILGKFLLHIKYEGNEVNQSDEKETISNKNRTVKTTTWLFKEN